VTDAAGPPMATSFGGNAERYDRLRPGYPRASVATVLEGLAGARVLDLGAGTGLLSAVLAAWPLDLTCVDPDPAMLAVLARRLPRARACAGTAEGVPAPDAAFDAVFAGQAFHWFSRPAADREIARVLRPGGVLAVLTNVNPPGTDYEGQIHAEVLGRPQGTLAAPPAPPDPACFGPPAEARFSNPVRMSRADFLMLPSTWSWVLTAGDDTRARVSAAAERTYRAIAGPDGAVTMPYVTRLIRAVRRTPSDRAPQADR
jgi:SAM-dependent methyltransferase